MRKELATVLSILCLNVILLSKVTPRYVTVVRKGMSRQSSCSTFSGNLKSSGDMIRLSFPFINPHVPALTPRIPCSEASLQFAENATFVFLWRVNTGIVREQNKLSSRCRGGIIYTQTVQYWGNGTVRNPCRYFYGRRKFVF
jgi:hypothetical protein